MVEQLPEVLPTVDPDLGSFVRRELEAHGITVLTGTKVEAVERRGGRLRVTGHPGLALDADLVLVVVGVRPDTELAHAAAVQLGVHGVIAVTRRMETSVPDVFAAGDCVETWHRVRQKYAHVPLGTTAHKQGRVAGENAVGGEREFAGSLGQRSRSGNSVDPERGAVGLTWLIRSWRSEAWRSLPWTGQLGPATVPRVDVVLRKSVRSRRGPATVAGEFPSPRSRPPGVGRPRGMVTRKPGY